MKKRAFIYIVLAGVLWGTSGLYVHFLAPLGLSSLQMSSVRATVAAVSMSIYVFLHNKKLFKINFKEGVLFALSGVAVFLTASSYYASMQATSVSTAVVLMYTAPVFVLIYSVAFLGEKLTTLKAIAICGMLVGCSFVSGIIGGLKFDVLGILLGLFAGVSYAIYNIVTKIQMQKKCKPLTASMYCFIFMMLASFLVSKPLHIVEVVHQHPYSILLMIGCGVCTSVLPYFLYTLALRVLPAGTASALGIVEPMAATIFSVLFLQERLNIFSICGIVLILGSVCMLSKSDG